jgi:hypothetical protein
MMPKRPHIGLTTASPNEGDNHRTVFPQVKWWAPGGSNPEPVRIKSAC